MSYKLCIQNFLKIKHFAYQQLIALNELSFERYHNQNIFQISMKVLIILNECQQLELSNNPNHNYIFLEISQRHHVDFLLQKEDERSQLLLVIISVLSILTLGFLTFLFSKNTIQNTSICYYILIFNHYLLIIPVMYIGIFNLANSINLGFSLISIVVSCFIEQIHIYLNTKIAFIEIEGSFSNVTFNVLLFIFNIIFCLIRVGYQNHILVIRIIQIFLKIGYCCSIIENQDKLVSFQLKIQIILIFQIFLNQVNTDWCIIIIYCLLGVALISAVRQRVIIMLLLKNDSVSLLKLQILSKLHRNSKSKLLRLVINSHISNQNEDNKAILHRLANFTQKVQFVNFLDEKNSIQGLLFLIETNFENINIFERIKGIALKERYHKKSTRHNKQNPDIKLFTKSLQIEIEINHVLERIGKEKTEFLVQLRRDIDEESYLKMIIRNFKKMAENLILLKDEFETYFDVRELKLINYDNSDILTLNHIAQYYTYFYLDLEKAQEIKSKIVEKIHWNKFFNAQIEANQLLVISISYVKEFGNIVNLNEHRFKQTFPKEKIIPINFQNLIPSFWQKCYRKQVSEFLEGSLSLKSPIQGVMKQNDFIIPCQVQLSYTIIHDDIVINQFIQVEKLQKDILYFNAEGKIIGISQEIFEHLMQKSENAFTQSLKITDFLENAMIQFYIHEMYSQVVSFQALVQQNQFTQRVRCQWKFPLNHQKCFLKVQQFYTDEASIAPSKSVSHFIYSQSTRRMFNNFKSRVTIVQSTDPQILSVPIKMIKPNYNEQLSKVVISSKSRSVEMEYDLSFQKYDIKEGEQIAIFKILFIEVEDMKSSLKQEQFIEQVLNKLEACESPEGIPSDRILPEALLVKKGIYKHIKLSGILLMLILGLLFVVSYLNTKLNTSDLIAFEYYYDYAIYPQAFTFEYAAIVLNQWNRYCSLNEIYNISELVESARLGALSFDNGIFLGRYNTDAMGCYLLSLDLGIENITLMEYTDSGIKKQTVNYLQFFDITRTLLDQMNRNNVVNYGTPLEDYSIINTTNLIRQNVIKIFTFCDVAMDALIQRVLDNIDNSTFRYNAVLIVECSIVFLVVILQTKIIFNTQQQKTKFFQLLTHINNNAITEIISILGQSHHNHTISQTTQNPSITNNLQNEKQFLNKSKQQSTHKLMNQNYKSWTAIILPFSYFLIFFVLSLTASFLHFQYYSEYQNSLIMTFKFVKLKKIFDGSVLLGELIKTEYLLDENSINYINQSEIISQFFNYTDQLLPLISDIINDFQNSNIFNQSTHDMINDALQSNLCEKFPSFYHFCTISESTLNYSEKDFTFGYLTQGVNGMMQSYQNLLLSEFSFERENLMYQTNKTLLTQYLNTQLHQNIFVQYFYDMEYLVFTSFQLFYNQTLILGQTIAQNLTIFFIVSGIVSLFVLLFEFILWAIFEDNEFNKLRLIVTLLPSSLLQNKSFSQLLMRLLNDIY